MTRRWWWLIAATTIGLFALAGWWVTRPTTPEPPTSTVNLTIPRALAAADKDRVTTATVTIGVPAVALELSNGGSATTVVPPDQTTRFTRQLENRGVAVSYTQPPARATGGVDWGGLFTMSAPVLLIGAIILYSVRTVPGGSSRAAIKRARVGELPDISLADVAGQPETVAQAREVVDLVRDSERYTRLGVAAPSGILLAGPPGNGKTLLARAMAGELEAPFFAAAGPDFIDKYGGAGPKAIRALFAAARKAANTHGFAVIFLDEVDAIGGKRSGGCGDGVGVVGYNTLNALLVEMDGFTAQSKVFVLAATNRPDMLDPALVRPGRFATTLTVSLPDRRGRAEIFQLYLNRRVAQGMMTADPAFDADAFAARLLGLSGAQISEVVAEAARSAARNDRAVMVQSDFEEALGRIVLGPERTSMVFTDEERRLTAWHEAGHTVAAFLEPHSQDPVQVTIVPRGSAGGVTWRPTSDNPYPTRKELFAHLVVAMGGKAAEMLVLDGEFTTGPGSDCVQGSQLAIDMVSRHGFSRLGSLHRVELMRLSGRIAEQVADEAQHLLDEALHACQDLFAVEVNRRFLERVAEELTVRETLHEDDIAHLWAEVSSPLAAA